MSAADPIVTIIEYPGPGRPWRRIEETRRVLGRVLMIERRILLNTGVERIVLRFEAGDESNFLPETIRDGGN